MPTHTELESVLVFWRDFGMPCIQGLHMDPKGPGTEIGMVLELGPSEIETPGTPAQSQGTKILVSKNFSYYHGDMLFYGNF